MIDGILHIAAELIWLNAMMLRWLVQVLVEDNVLSRIAKSKRVDGCIPKNMEEVLRPVNLSSLMRYSENKKIKRIVERRPEGVVGDGAQGTRRAWVEVFFVDGTSQRLFVKLHPTDTMIRSFINMIGLYDNENFFFANIASTIPSHLSVVTHCSRKVGSRCLYIQEDLYDSGHTLLSLVDTCNDQKIRAGLAALAELHSVHWGAPYKVWNEANRAPFTRIITEGAGFAFDRKYPGLLDQDMWTLLNKVTRNWSTLTDHWRQPPLTLIHGDAHLGNVYFRNDGTAAFYDWQLVSADTPLCDVSYFLFFAVSPENLAVKEKVYLQYYAKCLRGHLSKKGIEDIGMDDDRMWALYASRAVWSLLACTVTAGIGDFVPDQQLVRGFTRKVVQHVKRVNAMEEIDKILVASHTKKTC